MSVKKSKAQRVYEDDEDANLDYANFQKIDDKQYDNFLPRTNGKNNLSYFKNEHKYAGVVKRSKLQEEQEQEDGEQELSSDQEEDVDQADGIRQALNQIKSNRKQRSNLLSEDLKIIDREDKENLIKMKEQQAQEGNSQALQNQLTQFSKLAQIRYYSQKNIEQLKKYPTRNFPASSSLNKLQKQAQKASITSLQKLVENYQKLANTFFKTSYSLSNNSNIPSTHLLQTNRLDIEKLWDTFQQQTEQIDAKIQQQIINWSQRTTLLRNSNNKSQINSLLMQTPVGQAKKAVEDWQKVSKKCQMKRSPFRILFQKEENLRENYDKSIYDDIDLLQEVQKNYQQDLDKQDNSFLINDTLKYLENKNRTKVVKDVDRKASKNRKIRFNVHPKLLNFMPCQNENLLEARDEIVKNLFNKGVQLDPVVDFIDI